MNTYIITKKQENSIPVLHKLVFIIQLIAMFVVFLVPDFEIVCGPILALAFVFLFFAGYHEYVFGVIITANDALGTMFFGSFSFQYLLIALSFLKIIQKKTISKRRLVFFLIAGYLLLQLLIVETIALKVFINVSSYILAASAIALDVDEEVVKRFFTAVAITIVIISVHAMLTGGVDYYQDPSFSMIYDDEILRKGILGVGIGNPNHSALMLNIGIIAIWFFTSWKLIFKILCMIPIIYAFILTSSISALLALIVIVLSAFVIQRDAKGKMGKRVWSICLIALILICTIFIYSKLPESMRFEELDIYVERIEEKLGFAQVGDWDSATTNRTDLAMKYLDYIFIQQSLLKMFFGGNPLVITEVSKAVAHNNYIGLLLQIGLVGTIIFLGLAAKRFLIVCKESKAKYRKGRLLLKILCLFSAFGISLSGGSLWSFWMIILLLV